MWLFKGCGRVKNSENNSFDMFTEASANKTRDYVVVK
jgi:hypothetical protein